MTLREHFPDKEASYLDGTSDGWIYETIFAGASLQKSFDMIKDFLKQEGYGDLPLPKDAEELLLFKIPTRNKQILLFEDNGYVHNPIKILFPKDGKKRNMLILQVFNEKMPDHLVKFHRVSDRLKQQKISFTEP